MFSPRGLSIGISVASAMVLTSIVYVAAEHHPRVLAQMTPGVCWDTCSTPCEAEYRGCTTNAQRNPDQLAGCRTVVEACRNHCRDQCSLKR
jgi:hypothetical protein